MDHLINRVNYSGSPANHMLPHAEVKFFALYVVLKLKIIKEKLMSLKKKKIFLLFLEQKTTKKLTLNK